MSFISLGRAINNLDKFITSTLIAPRSLRIRSVELMYLKVQTPAVLGPFIPAHCTRGPAFPISCSVTVQVSVQTQSHMVAAATPDIT